MAEKKARPGRPGPRPNADTWKNEKKLPLVHWIMSLTGTLPPSAEEAYRAKPGEKVQVYHDWNQLIFPLPLALLPTLLRYYYYYYVDTVLPSAMTMWLILGLYTAFIGIMTTRHLNKLVYKYGYLDGGAGRDTISYELLPKILVEVFSASFIRPGLVILGCYNRYEKPHLTFWLPVQLFMLTILEDFTYYWLHRICHEVDKCWSFHRLHHTTKHPTTLFLAYADEIQEFVDAAGAPALSWLMCPFSFDVTLTWIFMHIYVQLAGHCGVRLHFGLVMTGPYLRPFGMDLVVEDHDLHHRHGWKDSYNYGKQSRLWDSLHGTTGERYECFKDNLDWSVPGLTRG